MSKTTIYQNQTGLFIHEGRIVRVLPSGTYRTYAFRNELIVAYPVYSQSYAYTIPVRTVEAAAVSVEITLGLIITDAQKLYISGESAYEAARRAIVKQLQAAAEVKTLQELLAEAITVDESLLQDALAEFGLSAKIELLPTIRLPRNLQNAIDAQEVARQKAKAELEEARGRSAVIRHYANVAKTTKDNPDLLRLLLGQKAKSINVAFDASERNTR